MVKLNKIIMAVLRIFVNAAMPPISLRYLALTVYFTKTFYYT